jgi:hypothetical protein
MLVRSANDARARDLVDEGIDLLITDSPALANYAASRPDAISIPLGWDKTWAAAIPRPGAIAIDSTNTFRAGLARDVVRADARATNGPFWWNDRGSCMWSPKSPAARRTSRVVYARDEPVAKGLAERIVALAGNGATAVGLMPDAFRMAVTSGDDLAYMVPLVRASHDRCRDLDRLASLADWIGAPGTIVPLIDTRLRAVARRDRLNLVFTADSAITVVPSTP